MERRKTPRKDWVVTQDDVGRAVLEWCRDPLRARRQESDPCARTYDFLNRLGSSDLELEENAGLSNSARSFDPYDHRPIWAGRRRARK